MSVLILEHLSPNELPQQWLQRLDLQPGQTVTVRIETEAITASVAEPIDAGVLAMSGLVPVDIDVSDHYHAAMLRKHTP